MIAPETPPRRVSRRAAIVKGVAIAAGAALLPIGGLAAVAAYERSNDPLLYALDEENVNAVAWSPDSTRFASVGSAGAQIWDAATGQRVRPMQTHASFDAVVWSADGRRLLTLQETSVGPNSAAFIQTVEVWDAATGQQLQSLHLTEPGYTGYAAVGLNEPYLAVNREIRAEDRAVTGGQRLQGKVIEIWEVAAGRMIAAFSGFPGRFVDPPGQIFWAPDRRRLAVIYDDRISANIQVEVVDAAARRRLTSFPIPRPTNLPPEPDELPKLPVAWAPDERSFAVGLDIYSADSGLHLSHFHADGHPVEAAAWSPDGQRLAVATVNRGPGLYASATNAIFLLDPSSGRQLAHYGAGKSILGLDIAFSPSSRYFLVTAAGSVELWRSG